MTPGPQAARRWAALSGCLALLVLGVVALVEARTFGLWRGDAPGPGLFPVAISVALVVLCVTALSMDWAGHGDAADYPADGDGLAGSRRLTAYTGALLGYALALEPLGYLMSTAVVFLFLLRWVEHLSWTRTIAFTVAALVLCEIVFVRLLAVDLPSGRLF
jgi:putative tricarboxylic transport membrane protein